MVDKMDYGNKIQRWSFSGATSRNKINKSDYLYLIKVNAFYTTENAQTESQISDLFLRPKKKWERWLHHTNRTYKMQNAKCKMEKFDELKFQLILILGIFWSLKINYKLCPWYGPNQIN